MVHRPKELILGQDCVVRVERGLIRPEDVLVVEPDPEAEPDAASLTVNAARLPYDRRSGGHADGLAQAVDLDITHWTATVTSYLGRVTKARIGEAVAEGVSAEAASWIGGLKKPDMAAEALLAGKGWLPGLLRAPVLVEAEIQEDAPSLKEEAA